MTTSLRNLTSFGDVAAEDDAVLDYFLATDAVAQIERKQAFLVLGRKGAGKTAIVRHFTEGMSESRSRPLNLRGYPWAIHAQRIDRGGSEVEAYVSSWRYLIALEFASMVLEDSERPQHDKVEALTSFFKDNYGGINPSLSDVLRPKRLRISKFSLQPTILGNSIGGVELERGPGDLQLGSELNALTTSIMESCYAIVANESLGPYVLHFDELDQGLSASDHTREKMLIGLIIAARDVRRECAKVNAPMIPVVYLRTDLWDDLEFSDKNKIGQTLTLRLEWTNESLLALVNERLKVKLAPSIHWESIVEPSLMRGSQTKWNHILARTFLRPRDVISFLNASLSESRMRPDEILVLSNSDIINAREQYSSYLKEELDDEILPHWPKWEQALQACSAMNTITFDREDFRREYEGRRTKDNPVGADDALALLYRFSVIGYSRRSGYGGSSWAFQYTDPQAGWDNAATRFKVHLGLKEYAKLREERI
ncbi:P-loop ATPase, Sll1717 family [Ectothiorhodospira shaposhnikovii]|uniref:P-loop ATPase, Sll1717 family n=1 Tax=Ectothiorhodospira shaposhnikovii TaxID=1054 RepID=UPI001EE8F555|nr:hypothetical protein [Ectothiorhodospira shaposhnikovii]MCG5514485.1 hypothetical protein [Ectothiorhodospira shaposhnikovii]